MDNLVTISSILEWFKDRVSRKEVIDQHTWIDSAQKINVLMGDEHDKLFDLQQQVAQKKVRLIDIGEPTSRAKAKVEATDEYRAMCRQKARIEQAEEHIRIAKIMARMKVDEQNNYR